MVSASAIEFGYFRVNYKGYEKHLTRTHKVRVFCFIFVVFFDLLVAIGTLAQLVEQRTENPCVPSSILGGTTTNRHLAQLVRASR